MDIWHDSETFASALLELRERYGFDGVLVNLPGREPEWRTRVLAIEEAGGSHRIRWRSGALTICPPDDNPHVVDPATGRPVARRFDDIDVATLHYIEPHGETGVGNLPGFPPWQWDTLRSVRERAPDVSVHGEVFSPLSQVMELVGPMEAALAVALDPPKMRAALERLAAGTIEHALAQVGAGADAVLISSAYAGSGFLSPAHYEQFVLPSERAVIAGIKASRPDVPVYTHTCGAIADRLELMVATGTDGIDTLDPPPLGNVDLADAKRRLGGRVFIKGNVDPVNVILRGTPEACYRDATERIAIAAPGGGYVLSSACSVPPHASPANIEALTRAACDSGSVP
jgi:hypothetical protein